MTHRHPYSPYPKQAVRRFNTDVARAILDAEERGVSREQIAIRMREAADGLADAIGFDMEALRQKAQEGGDND